MGSHKGTKDEEAETIADQVSLTVREAREEIPGGKQESEEAGGEEQEGSFGQAGS